MTIFRAVDKSSAFRLRLLTWESQCMPHQQPWNLVSTPLIHKSKKQSKGFKITLNGCIKFIAVIQEVNRKRQLTMQLVSLNVMYAYKHNNVYLTLLYLSVIILH